MSKPKKIAYHVKLTAQALNLSTYNDENIQKIFDIMLSTYQEYNLESKIKLKSEIQVAFHEYTSSLLSKASQAAEKISSLSSSSSTVLSLNQTIRNNYLGTTSKRQIPVDPSEVKQEISTSPSSVVTDIIPTGSDKSVNDSNSNNDVNIVTESTKPNINTQSDNNKTTEKTSKTSKRQKLSNENASSSSSTSSQVFTSLFSANISCPRPMNRLHDFAGLDSIIRQLKELVFFPVMYPEIYAHLGVQPSISILLQGPTGCGKTSLALAIAGELNLPFFKVSGPELIGGTSGESEERVRESFKAAATAAPSILFLDSLDVLASKKDSTQRGMDRRVIAQLCDSIDCITNLTNSDSPQPTSAQPIYDMSIAKDISVSSSSADLLMNNIYGKVNMKANKLVVLISATNKADVLEPSVRGRFNKELSLPVPDAPSRTQILRLMATKLRLSTDVSFEEVGRATPGFVGADLRALVTEAGMTAVARIITELGLESTENSDKLEEVKNYIFGMVMPSNYPSNTVASTSTAVSDDEMMISIPANTPDISTPTISSLPTEYASSLCVQMKDFLVAIKSIQPSAKREGFAVVPDVTWDDVGALIEVREELLNNVLEPIAHPERFKSLGLETPAGVLFFGPPGCGKTLLAKAVANQSGANFISVKGPELLNMYVGESESRVRQVFARARSSTPCVIFFDELDALCPKRGSGAEGGNGVSERVVNQLLTELDGLESRKDVYVIAATNRLELIDDAMLRPGRIGKLLYVPLPTPTDRVGILQALVRKVSVNTQEVDLSCIATDGRADGYSGADLSALVREAGLCVMREWKKSTQDASFIQQHSSSTTSSSSIAISLLTSEMPTVICQRHFESALSIVKPSVTREDRDRFERVQQLLRQGLGALQALKAARDLFTANNNIPSNLKQSPRKRNPESALRTSFETLKRLREDTTHSDDNDGNDDNEDLTGAQALATYPILLSHSFTTRSGHLWCQCCAVEVESNMLLIQDHIGVDHNWVPITIENNHRRLLETFQRNCSTPNL